MLHHILAAPLVAIVVTVVFMQAAVLVAGSARRRDYRRFEDQSGQKIVERFAFPEVAPGEAQERYRRLTTVRDRTHQAANAAQTRYYNAVLRSSGCLVLAFLALAFSMLLSSGMPEEVRVPLERLVAWLDATATLAVLALFLDGRLRNAPWLSARSCAELMRQYQILETVLPGPQSRAGETAEAAEAEAARIARLVDDGPSKTLATRVEQIWHSRRAEIAARAMDRCDLAPEGLLLYLTKRPRRQLVWFVDSGARLEHIAERRKKVLLGLYIAAVALSLLNLVLLLMERPLSDYIHPVLLIVVGLAAAMTALSVNQNSRSLIHRYRIQERSIAGWLDGFDRRWGFSTLSATERDAATKAAMRDEILKFEDLMIEELIDWLYITSHDSIELAP